MNVRQPFLPRMQALRAERHLPDELKGRNYSEQDWFQQVSRKGVLTSDVFFGHRKSPHFAIAVRHEWEKDDYYILRATIDAEMLREQIQRGKLY